MDLIHIKNGQVEDRPYFSKVKTDTYGFAQRSLVVVGTYSNPLRANPKCTRGPHDFSHGKFTSFARNAGNYLLACKARGQSIMAWAATSPPACSEAIPCLLERAKF